jgi:uncharacterized membrane protein
MSDRLSAIISVVQGLGILGLWASFVRGGVFKDGPRTVENNQYLGFHVAAEVLMGVLLVAGGVGLLLQRWWGAAVGLVAWGMVVYSAINALSHSTRNDQKLTPLLAVSIALGVWVLRRIATPTRERTN